MKNLAEAIRIVSVLIEPFMHSTTREIRKQLGMSTLQADWEEAFTFDVLAGARVQKGRVLFPRLDVEKELEELAAIKAESDGAKSGETDKDEPEDNSDEQVSGKPEIEYDDFDKIDLRVGVITEAEKHPKADRLLVFKVKMGGEIRQIISGVADYFTPEEMVGKKVIVVANLKPRKLRGMESKGMLLFADNGQRLEIVTTDAEDGNSVS